MPGDCNENGIPDDCDIADGIIEDCNTNGAADACESDLGGDFDGDGLVGLADYASLVDCLAGPNETPGASACLDMCLAAFDNDHDGDVDLQDAGAFHLLFVP